MPNAALLSLLAAFGGSTGDPAASRPLSLTEMLAPAPAVAPAPQGVAYDRAQPIGWISGGIWFTSSEQSLPASGEPDEDEPLGLELGFFTWKNNEMGLGVELAAIHSEYKLDVTSIDTETVDVWRGMLGLRLVDAGISQRFAPFARAGLLWRSDSGDILDDTGFGYYLGAGMDWYLAGGLALTPSLLYQDSNSYNTTEWLFGIALTFQF